MSQTVNGVEIHYMAKFDKETMIEVTDFKIKDDTDLNEMVCEYYYLSKSKALYSLLLSYVGLYGVILKINKRKVEVITDNVVENIDQKKILQILEHYNNKYFISRSFRYKNRL